MSSTRNRPTVIAGGKVDVEALFGAQAKKRTKRKSGALTTPRVNTLTHADSFALSVTVGFSLDAECELERMQAAELEQTETDGFWGFDKERCDKESELELMTEEDKTSAENERLRSISFIQQQWEKEEKEQTENARISAAVDEEHARLAYMEVFYTTESSGGVLAYSWPTRPTVTIEPEIDTATGLAVHKQGFDIHCSDYGNISTVHVNGMQRAQEISAGGEIALPSESQNVAALAMRPPGTRTIAPGKTTKQHGSEGKSTTRQLSPRVKGPSTSTSPRLPSTPPSPGKEQQMSFTRDQWDTPGGQSAFTTGGQSQRQGSSRVKLMDLASRYVKDSMMMVAGAGRKHNALYDGHSIYRWDQEQILRVVFSILDDNSVGHIGRSQISEIARNADIQDMLKYTLFWLPLKRRQWTFFYGIFDDDNESIGVEEWLNAARDLAASEEVRISNVRLDEEQRSIADACSVTGDWSEARFASETRSQIYNQHRAAATLRLVAPGDLVWALYSKGCRWLPARVLSVNNHDGHSLVDSSLTVQYILSTREFKLAQSDTTTREFLPKPNVGTTQPQAAVVKPFKTEVEVCNYVFDMVDENCRGVVKSVVLASKLRDPVLHHVVNTSAVLSCLVQSNDTLLEMLCEMFPGDEGDTDGGDVTKQEFADFCSVVCAEGMQLQQ